MHERAAHFPGGSARNADHAAVAVHLYLPLRFLNPLGIASSLVAHQRNNGLSRGGGTAYTPQYRSVGGAAYLHMMHSYILRELNAIEIQNIDASQ